MGLGLKFLAHIERCQILLHVCDLSVQNDYKFLENYKTIRLELKNYGKSVEEKKEIILLSKSDLVNKEAISHKIKKLQKITSSKIFYASSKTLLGIEELKNYFLKDKL